MAAPISNDQTGNSSKQWSMLPPAALAQVFQLLDNQDVISAGSTCRGWRSVRLLPEFFRKKKIEIIGWDRNEVAPLCARAVSYMMNFGRNLRHLILDIGSPTVNTSPTISKSVKKLLTPQPQMKLLSLSCDAILLGYHEGRYTCHKNRIVNALANFLANQSKYLREVNLRDNNVSLEDILSLLRALAASTDPPARLAILNLSGFFDDSLHMEMCPEVSDVMGRFSALKTLFLDFIHLADNMLEQLTIGSPLLETLNLTMHDFGLLSERKCASTAGWRAAVQRLPKLQVIMDMGTCDDMDLNQLLVPAMPIISLSVLFDAETQNDLMANILLHLCQHFAGSLELFQTHSWTNPDPWTRPKELVELVTRCSSLTCLAIKDSILSEETLMEVAAARPHSASLHRPVQLELHLGSCNNLGYRVLQRMSAINTACFVRVCHADFCALHPYKPILVHD